MITICVFGDKEMAVALSWGLTTRYDMQVEVINHEGAWLVRADPGHFNAKDAMAYTRGFYDSAMQIANDSPSIKPPSFLRSRD